MAFLYVAAESSAEQPDLYRGCGTIANGSLNGPKAAIPFPSAVASEWLSPANDSCLSLPVTAYAGALIYRTIVQLQHQASRAPGDRCSCGFAASDLDI